MTHGMITTIIHGLDIEELLEFFSDSDSTILKRVWGTEYRINAVFVQEMHTKHMYIGQTLIIIVDHDVRKDACKVEAMRLPGGSESMVAFAAAADAEPEFQKIVEELAQNHGWPYETHVVPESYRGSKCPSCGAIYVYPREKILSDGSVRCQNCGRSFVPSQE